MSNWINFSLINSIGFYGCEIFLNCMLSLKINILKLYVCVCMPLFPNKRN